MWCYFIANVYFIVLFQNSYSCVCSENHATHVHSKGETEHFADYKEKRHLEYKEFNSTQHETETYETDKHPRSLVNETFNVDYFTTVELSDANTESNTITDETTTYTTDTTTVSEVTEYTTLPEKSEEETTTTINKKESKDVISSSQDTNEFFNDNSQLNDVSDVGELTLSQYGLGTHEPKETTSAVTEAVESDMEQQTEKVSESKYINTVSDTEPVVDCKMYKKSKKLDLDKMVDIWKITYYTMPHVLKCFKLHIKMLTTEDQIYYAKTYGNFENTVHWDKIKLEIQATDDNHVDVRKHFLESHDSVDSVMKNIIIQGERTVNTTAISLVHEVSDQWLVIKNLLLMRDCDTGDIVMFTRLPYNPKINDIEEALELFNEPRKLRGSLAC